MEIKSMQSIYGITIKNNTEKYCSRLSSLAQYSLKTCMRDIQYTNISSGILNNRKTMNIKNNASTNKAIQIWISLSMKSESSTITKITANDFILIGFDGITKIRLITLNKTWKLKW